MKRAINYVGIGIVVISIYFFVRYSMHYITTMPKMDWNLNTIMIWAGMIIIYSSIPIIGSYAWSILLRSIGEFTKLKEIIMIYSISQFAKYIPGNVAQHIGRVTLSKSCDLKLSKVIISMMLEMLLLVLTGIMLCIVSLLLVDHKYFEGVASSIPSIWLFVTIAILLIFLVFIIRRIYLKSYATLFKEMKKEIDNSIFIKSIIKCVFLYLVAFMLMGIIPSCIAYGIYGIQENHIFLLIGIFTISWVLGFVIPGAPAGLGIREVILISSLTMVFSEGIAIGITISLRLISIISDLLVFIVALVAKTIYRNRTLIQLKEIE